VALTSHHVPGVPAHTHTISVSTAAAAETNPQNRFLAATVDTQAQSSPAGYNPAATAGATLNTASVNTASVNPAGAVAGGSTPVDIRQPVPALNYIIATAGVFPSHQ
jgi:microcystin-dependent protein